MNTASSSFFTTTYTAIWNWCVLHFSLRKLVYVFLFTSITLAISYQTIKSYPEISLSHPYSDVLIYEKLGNNRIDLFGSTHITHRVLFPSVLSLFNVFPYSAFPFLVALFHLLLLILVLFKVFKQKDGFSFVLFTLMLLSLPSFWRGFFLPMPDTLLWAFLSLFWLEYIREKPSFIWLFFLFLGALFTKEVALLSLLFVFYTFKPSRFAKVIPVLFAVVIFLITNFYFSKSYASNYIFSPELWSKDWVFNLFHESIWIPKYLLSGFSAILIFWMFRIYVSKSYHFKDIVPEILLFVVIFLFAATNSPRILFSFTGIMAIRLMQKEYFLK